MENHETETENQQTPDGNRIKAFLEELWFSAKPEYKWFRPIVQSARIWIVSIREFIQDDCLSRASAIAYTAIISLIPTLTVGLSLFSAFSGIGTKKEQLFEMANKYLKDHNINIDISPLTNAIESLTENAAGVGGIGLLVMIFSATAVLRTLEKTFNNIWHVQTKRSILMKIIYYWAALTLGPILLATGGSLSGYLGRVFTMPAVHDVLAVHETFWFAGNRGFIRRSNPYLSKTMAFPFANVDLDNQKIYILKDNYFEPVSEDLRILSIINEKDLHKLNFRKLTYHNGVLWAITEQGVLLFSKDNGNDWNLMRLGQKGFGLVGNYAGLDMYDLIFLDDNIGYLACAGGVLLRTGNGGRNWHRVPLALADIDAGVFNSNLYDLFFNNNENGFILADNGYLLKTTDSGITWDIIRLDKARKKNEFLSLYAMDGRPNGFWIVGEKGLILTSNDAGQNWIVRSKGDSNYNDVLAIGAREAVVVGDDGYLLYTNDGGDRWIRTQKSGWHFNVVHKFKDEIIAYGDNLSSFRFEKKEKNHVKWTKITGGQSVLYGFINFFAPFLVIWILFVIAYLTLPNTRVPFRPAAIGASITAAVWVLFILGFQYYISYFMTGTRAVYGTLAIIPIFLLVIYASSVITLFGAEITYTLQNPKLYAQTSFFRKKKIGYVHVFDGIHILYEIFRNFYLGKGPTHEKLLVKLVHGDMALYRKYIQLFLDNGYITITGIDGYYIPNKAGELISLEELLIVITDKDFDIVNYSDRNPLMRFMQRKFNDLEHFRSELVHGITMAYLVRNLHNGPTSPEPTS